MHRTIGRPRCWRSPSSRPGQAQPAARPADDLLRHQRRLRQGRRLGGLAGRRRALPGAGQAAGAGGKTWRAYLSTRAAANRGQRARPHRHAVRGGTPRARSIAKDLADLHGDQQPHQADRADREGRVVNGRGDTPNMHDILTGSQPDGTAFAGGEDRTCGNWTKSGARARPWSATTTGRACATIAAVDVLELLASLARLQPGRAEGTGGAGLFYCFAAD